MSRYGPRRDRDVPLRLGRIDTLGLALLLGALNRRCECERMVDGQIRFVRSGEHKEPPCRWWTINSSAHWNEIETLGISNRQRTALDVRGVKPPR